MLNEFMETNYNTYRMSFGKNKGQFLSDIEVDYACWWIDKREKDETHGTCEIDIDHKIAAERKHGFNRTYIFMIYHLYQRTGTKHTGYGTYETMATKFWFALDNKVDFESRGICRDEIDSFFYSLWSDEIPSF